MNRSYEELVHLATFHDPFEAQVVRSRLTEAGIESHLENEMVSNALWTLTAAVGGIRVMVMARNFERAEAILAKIESDRQAAEEDEVLDHEGEEEDDESGGGQWSDGDEDDELPAPESREAVVERAFRATILASVFWPLLIYSVYLVCHYSTMDEPLPERVRRKAILTAVLNVAFLAVVALVWRAWNQDQG